MKQFIFINTDGYYEEGAVDGHGETRACDASLAPGDLVCESSSITNGVDKVTSNAETRSVIGYVTNKPTTTTAEILFQGTISGTFGLTKAGKVYLSDTGGFTDTIPASGYLKTLGQAIDADTIDFDPSITKVKIYEYYIAPDSDTLLLIESNTYDGNTTFVDETGNATFTLYGSPKHSSTQAKFGNTSMYFDGSSALFADMAFSLAGDFTIDFWLYRIDGIVIFNTGIYNVDYNFFYRDGYRYGYNYGSTHNYYVNFSTVGTQVWTHVAFVRDVANQKISVYYDGVLETSSSYGSTYDYSSNDGFILGSANDTTSNFHNAAYFTECYIDEFRVSTVQRWTANFTPPSAPYTKIGS
jgi:hypothetical protein